METRRLIVIRHAAAVVGCSSSDRWRDLTPEGQIQAQVLGSKLSGALEEPLKALISPANRTVQTWQILAKAAGLSTDAIESAEERDEIYWRWADEILDLVREVPSDASTLVIVGHEPTVSALAALVAEPGLEVPHGMPTGSAVVLSSTKEWADWNEGTATKAFFLR